MNDKTIIMWKISCDDSLVLYNGPVGMRWDFAAIAGPLYLVDYIPQGVRGMAMDGVPHIFFFLISRLI